MKLCCSVSRPNPHPGSSSWDRLHAPWFAEPVQTGLLKQFRHIFLLYYKHYAHLNCDSHPNNALYHHPAHMHTLSPPACVHAGGWVDSYPGLFAMRSIPLHSTLRWTPGGEEEKACLWMSVTHWQTTGSSVFIQRSRTVGSARSCSLLEDCHNVSSSSESPEGAVIHFIWWDLLKVLIGRREAELQASWSIRWIWWDRDRRLLSDRPEQDAGHMALEREEEEHREWKHTCKHRHRDYTGI